MAGNIDDEREPSEDEPENENPANTEKIVQEYQEAQSKSEEEQVIFRPKKGQDDKWGGGQIATTNTRGKDKEIKIKEFQNSEFRTGQYVVRLVTRQTGRLLNRQTHW